MSWRQAILGDIVRIARSGISAEDIKPGTKYVGLEHINSEGDFTDVREVAVGELASTKFVFTQRHVLFGKLRPYLKKTARPDFGGICSTDILPLEPGSEIDRDFLFHVLRRQQFVDDVSSLCAGANLPRISPKVLSSLKIPLPPLAEQRRIAAILDKADALRAKRREAIAKLDQLLQSVFLDMFGDPATNPKRWAVTNVDNIGDVQGGLQLSGKRRSLPLQVPYLRVANVYRERIDLSEIKRFGLTAAEREKTTLVKDDILIVEGHGNPEEIGRCAIWDGSIDGCSHQNHLIRLRINEELATPVFVSHYLNSKGGRMGLTRASNTTSGLNTISVSKVRSCPVFLPPLDLQQQFAQIVGSVRQRRSDLQVQEVRLQALVASLQHRAFCGTL